MSNSSMKNGKTLESTHYSSAYDRYKQYGKYFSQKHSNRYGNSSFWMDDIVDSRTDAESKFDILKMAQYQRAIANFVKIVARKDIPVKFHSGDQSYTDGQSVVISANVNDKTFDPTAGLALHESSHILLTDFNASKKYFSHYTRSQLPLESWINTSAISHPAVKVVIMACMPYAASKNFQLSNSLTVANLFELANWIEDRRIDNEIFKMAPGYKTYYHALYEKYYLSKEVTVALKSGDYRDEDVKSYLFRFKALLNPASDPKALKGLRTLINLLDIHNISRLQNTEDAIKLALTVGDVIVKYVDEAQSKGNGPGQGSNDSSQSDDDKKSQPKSQNDEHGDDESDTEFGDDVSEDDNLDMPGDGDMDAEDSTPALPRLSNRELSKAEKAMQEIDKLLSGDVKKTKANKEVSKVVDTIAGSNEFNVDTVDFHGNKIPVMKLYLSERALRSSAFPIVNDIMDGTARDYQIKGKHYSIPPTSTWSSRLKDHQKVIENGLNLGSQLGRKLKVRDQVRDTKYTRLKSGKIDGRILYQAGFDATNIFHHINLDKYIPSVIDISIDASSSMSGKNWLNTQTAVLAIAKACSMIQNVRVKISYRYECSVSTSGRRSRSSDALVLVDVYDSKRDKLQHLINCILGLIPINTTPDSLITRYQLNKKLITPGSAELNSYFINFSDGGPGCHVANYGGRAAHEHIMKCRKEIESLNVKVLSYLIATQDTGSTASQFKTDWGKENSKIISVTDVVALANTMNEMFLSK